MVAESHGLLKLTRCVLGENCSCIILFSISTVSEAEAHGFAPKCYTPSWLTSAKSDDIMNNHSTGLQISDDKTARRQLCTRKAKPASAQQPMPWRKVKARRGYARRALMGGSGRSMKSAPPRRSASPAPRPHAQPHAHTRRRVPPLWVEAY